MSHASLSGPQGYNPYDLLRVYTYYRTLLGGLLLLMFQMKFAPQVLGNDNPAVFFYGSLAYTAINFMTLVMMRQAKYAPSQVTLFGSLLIDVVAISLLMHASGGAVSNLGYLLLIAIAAGGIMLRERYSLFLAAIASLIVLGEGAYRFVILTQDNKLVFTSGMLGALAFLTALLFHHLTKKIRTSYAEAEAQAKQAAHLQKLAQLIVERMRTGILVLNNQLSIELHNHSALKLLSTHNTTLKNIPLSDFPDLYKKYKSWQHNGSDHSPFLKIEGDTSNEIRVSFAYLEPDKTHEVLIFLEDVRSLNQQAQQLKLASLGRLTASIAHEIRNPLGAISHAGQLLAESPQLPKSDLRLLDIINNHSTRVNQIIENILQLSRRKQTQTLPINLREWVPAFIRDYKASKNTNPPPEIALLEKNLRDNRLETKTKDLRTNVTLEAKFDTSQLTQVLSNLCDNGLRYSIKKTGRPDLRLEIGVDISQHQPYIRVIDYGAGISEDNAKHLFEPFFTTENTGSGLGLYICKELCEANQAIISYKRTLQGESCFHIQLAHPEKSS
jgi:two-component system sensor histidine kinase PilS (NtrC family)